LERRTGTWMRPLGTQRMVSARRVELDSTPATSRSHWREVATICSTDCGRSIDTESSGFDSPGIVESGARPSIASPCQAVASLANPREECTPQAAMGAPLHHLTPYPPFHFPFAHLRDIGHPTTRPLACLPDLCYVYTSPLNFDNPVSFSHLNPVFLYVWGFCNCLGRRYGLWQCGPALGHGREYDAHRIAF
jgi:hypothetical protein